MSSKSYNAVTKIFAIVTLTAFCATQTIWAAPSLTRQNAQNMRQVNPANAIGGGDSIKGELLSPLKKRPVEILGIEGFPYAEGERGDCGVFAHTGPTEAEGGLKTFDVVYTGIKGLQHRGYQSSGFSVLHRENGRVTPITRKALGGAKEIRPTAKKELTNISAEAKLTHVRWPTTAPGTIPNAHPITAGNVIIAFNGDVTNFSDIDKFLETMADQLGDDNLRRPAGIGTDAWTIAALIYYFYTYKTEHNTKEDLLKAAHMAHNKMEGYFAISLLCTDFPNIALGFIKGNMPLFVGLGENREGAKIGNFLSSEVSAFVNWARYSQKLSQGDFAVISENSAEIYRESGGELKLFAKTTSSEINQVTQIKQRPPDKPRIIEELRPEEYFYELEPPYRFFAEQEIAFQPEALAQTIFGYVPPSLYPDKLPYEMSSSEKRADRAYRNKLLRHIIKTKTIPTSINGRPVQPSRISENRIEVLQNWINNPQEAEANRISMRTINLSPKEIRRFKHVLFACSGTAGYASEAQQLEFKIRTGMDDTVQKSGTAYVDEIEYQLRAIIEGLRASGIDLSEFIAQKDIETYFLHGGFKENATPEDMVVFINALKNVYKKDRFKQVPEMAVFKNMLKRAGETLGVAVTQSGGTKDTLNIIDIGQALGIRFLGVVNRSGVTDIAEKCKADAGEFKTYAQDEKGVASFKAFTSQQAAVKELGLYFGLVRGTTSPQIAQRKLNELLEIPALAQAILRNSKLRQQMRYISEEIKGEQAVVFFGRSLLFPIAKEGGLKTKELTYVAAGAEDLGEMKHGPIAWFPGTTDPLLAKYGIVLLTQKYPFPKSFLNTREIVGRAGTPIAVCFEGDKRWEEFLLKDTKGVLMEISGLKEHLQLMQQEGLKTEAYLEQLKKGKYADTILDAQKREKLVDLLNKLVGDGMDLETHIDRLQNDRGRMEEGLKNIIYIPRVSDDLSGILSVIPLQLLAFETTLAIDKVSKKIGELTSELYWSIVHIKEGDTNNKTWEKRFNRAVIDLHYHWNDMLDTGDLNMLSAQKVRQIKKVIGDVEASPNLVEKINRTERLIDLLSGKGIARINFFTTMLREHRQGLSDFEQSQLDLADKCLKEARQKASQLKDRLVKKRPASMAAAKKRLTSEKKAKQEDVILVDATRQAEKRFMEIAYEGLEPILSQIAERQSHKNPKVRAERLITLYNNWFSQGSGIAEYLARSPDQPRGLAKIVTVENKLNSRMREAIHGLPLSEEVKEQIIEKGAMRLEFGKITGRRSVLQLLAEIISTPATPQPQSFKNMVMAGYSHEVMHKIFTLYSLTDRISFTKKIMAAINTKEGNFIKSFMDDFGGFDSYDKLVEELVIKYYTAKLDGEIPQYYTEDVRNSIEKACQNVRLIFTKEQIEALKGIGLNPAIEKNMPKNIHELFDADFTPSSLAPNRSNESQITDKNVIKTAQLSSIAHVFGLNATLYFEPVENAQQLENEIAIAMDWLKAEAQASGINKLSRSIQQDPKSILEELRTSNVSSLAGLQEYLQRQQIESGLLTGEDRQSIIDAVDNYHALHQVFQENLNLDNKAVIELIERQAAASNTTFIQQVQGYLDVPDSELPKDEEFSNIIKEAEVILKAGGNSGRAVRLGARVAGLRPINVTPVWDDGGNYGTWRSSLNSTFDKDFVFSWGGDQGNIVTVLADLMVRQAMADRMPEKKDWAENDTPRSLILKEIKHAFDSYKLQHIGSDPTVEPSLVRSLATLISASRIVSRSFPDIMQAKLLSKGSGQNIMGEAIALRTGFQSTRTKQTDPNKTKQAVLLWNRVLGLDENAGLVIPATLDGARIYFVYADKLPAEPILQDKAVTAIKLGDSEIAPEDYFTVIEQGGLLLLTDGLGRILVYDKKEQAYIARENGQVVNRFEAFPDRVRRRIIEGIFESGVLSIVRGEDHASEEDSIYENTHVIAWGAEYKTNAQPHASQAAEEINQGILNNEIPAKVIIYGPGSEATSIAPHFWVPEEAKFLEELARRRKAGEVVPRVVFIFNPAETNDSYGLGPLGIIENYELIFRQMLNDDSVSFQDLIPEVMLFDHDLDTTNDADSWIRKVNRTVADEMCVASLEDVNYLHLLGPLKDGERHGLVKKNRRPMPLNDEIRTELQRRFGKENVHIGPYGDVRGTVESSRGKITRAPRVEGISHRLGIVLYPWQRAHLLPIAAREETRIYQEKHGGQSPAPQALADFLNKVGYNTTPEEINKIVTAGSAGQLTEGTDYQNIGNGIRFLRAAEIKGMEILPNGVTIDPTKRNEIEGATITIGTGASLLKNATLEGSIVIGENATIGGYLGGSLEKPAVVGDNAEIYGLTSDIRRSVIGPGVKAKRTADIADTVIVPMEISSRNVPATVGTGAILEGGSAILGGNVGSNVKFRHDSLIGPFVNIANNSEHKAVLFLGASENATVDFPHAGYMGDFWAVPLQIDGDIEPFTVEYYNALKHIMRAILFGNIKRDIPDKDAPISEKGSRRRIIAELDGEDVEFSAQRINFGANTITSTFNPLTGIKSAGTAEGGVAAGVDSVLENPVSLGNLSLVGNLSMAEGTLTTGTVISGNVKGGFKLEGYRAPDKRFMFGDGLAEDIKLQMDYFSRLKVAAEVFNEGARRAADPFTLAGYQAGLDAISGQFDELEPKFAKIFGDAIDESLKALVGRQVVLGHNLKLLGTRQTATSDETTDTVDKFKKAEAELLRVNNRIKEQKAVKDKGAETLKGLEDIKQTIHGLQAALAESASRKTIAEAVRKGVLDPHYKWVNPLAPAFASATGEELEEAYNQARQSWWKGWGNIHPQEELRLIEQGRQAEFMRHRAETLLAIIEPIAAELHRSLYDYNRQDLAYGLLKSQGDGLIDNVKEYVEERLEKMKGLSDEEAAEVLKKEFASDDPDSNNLWNSMAGKVSKWGDEQIKAFKSDIVGRFSSFSNYLVSMVHSGHDDGQENFEINAQGHVILEFLNRYRTRYIIDRDAGGHLLSKFPLELRNEKFIIDIVPDPNPEALDPMPWDVPGFERLAQKRVKPGDKGYSIHIVLATDPKITEPLKARVAALEALASASGIEDTVVLVIDDHPFKMTKTVEVLYSLGFKKIETANSLLDAKNRTADLIIDNIHRANSDDGDKELRDLFGQEKLTEINLYGLKGLGNLSKAEIKDRLQKWIDA